MRSSSKASVVDGLAPFGVTISQLCDWVSEARDRTVDLIADLSTEQLVGPQLTTVNPLLWELGHVAWFQEKWVLRHAFGCAPLRPSVDQLYDSSAIAHDDRWVLPLPTREQTVAYLHDVRDAVVERLQESPGDAIRREMAYFTLLSVFHEDMHTEAFTYTRQTLGHPAPRLGLPTSPAPRALGSFRGDVEIPGGVFPLGASDDGRFVFDNEKWAHEVPLAAFSIARAPVTQEEFRHFVEDGGYARPEFWTTEGWQWRSQANSKHPVYWSRTAAGWRRRHFDQLVPLEPDQPVIHANWYEADAYCRWAKRRLPTEAEWELAAAGTLAGRGLSSAKRAFPWGDAAPDAHTANLDWRHMGCVAIGALPDGDSAFGCRQMIGNVWEWTASDFLPYPGFQPDTYKEYSQPWFGTRKVLRGGCWATRGRLLRNTWRNFFTPDRRDVFAGFRSCAPDA